jgi:hypothetical protein
MMRSIRTIFAGLIALAVAVAPVAAALLAGAEPRAATAATVHDCHGKSEHHDKVQDLSNDGSCADCSQDGATCIGDGGKCCKLTGMVMVLPVVLAPAEPSELAVNGPALTGRQVRPPPPPPQT